MHSEVFARSAKTFRIYSKFLNLMKGADCSTDYIHYTDCFPVLRQVFGFCNQTESVLLAGQTKDLTQFNSCPHVTGQVM